MYSRLAGSSVRPTDSTTLWERVEEIQIYISPAQRKGKSEKKSSQSMNSNKTELKPM